MISPATSQKPQHLLGQSEIFPPIQEIKGVANGSVALANIHALLLTPPKIKVAATKMLKMLCIHFLYGL